MIISNEAAPFIIGDLLIGSAAVCYVVAVAVKDLCTRRRDPRPVLTIQPIPVESWAERKAAYDRVRAHHDTRGQSEAYARLRTATNEALRREQQKINLEHDLKIVEDMAQSHPWIFRGGRQGAQDFAAYFRERSRR